MKQKKIPGNAEKLSKLIQEKILNLEKDKTMYENMLKNIYSDLTENTENFSALISKLSEENSLTALIDYKIVFEQNTSAMVITKLDNGEILDINLSYTQNLGYGREIIGKKSTEIQLFNNLKQRKEYIEKLKNEGFVKNYQTILNKKNGEKIFVILSSNIIKFNNENCMLTSFFEISRIQNNIDELIDEKNILKKKTDEYYALYEEYKAKNEDLIKAKEIIEKSENNFRKLL